MKKQQRSIFQTPLTKPLGGGFLGNFSVKCVVYDHGAHLDDEGRYGADIEGVNLSYPGGAESPSILRVLQALESAGECSILDDIRAAAVAHAQSYWEEKNAQAVTAHVDRREPMHEYKPDSETLHG